MHIVRAVVLWTELTVQNLCIFDDGPFRLEVFCCGILVLCGKIFSLWKTRRRWVFSDFLTFFFQIASEDPNIRDKSREFLRTLHVAIYEGFSTHVALSFLSLRGREARP